MWGTFTAAHTHTYTHTHTHQHVQTYLLSVWRFHHCINNNHEPHHQKVFEQERVVCVLVCNFVCVDVFSVSGCARFSPFVCAVKETIEFVVVTFDRKQRRQQSRAQKNPQKKNSARQGHHLNTKRRAATIAPTIPQTHIHTTTAPTARRHESHRRSGAPSAHARHS